MVNPIKIAQGLNALGKVEGEIYFPYPGDDPVDGDAFARKLGRDALDSMNPFNKKSAFDTGKSTANVASVVRAGAVGKLNGLRTAVRAADLGVATARAGAEAAAGTSQEAAALAGLRAAQAQAVTARAALRGALPGAGAVRGVKRAAQAVTRGAGRAKSAAAAARARRAGGGRDPNDPLAPHDDDSRRQARADQDRMQARRSGAGRPAGRGQPALAGAGDGGAGGVPNRPIGKPSVMMSEVGKGATGGNSLKAEQLYDAKTRGLARQHGILYDEASALKEVWKVPLLKEFLKETVYPLLGRITSPKSSG